MKRQMPSLRNMIEPRGQSRTVRRTHRGAPAFGGPREREAPPPARARAGGSGRGAPWPARLHRLPSAEGRRGARRRGGPRSQGPETRKTASGATPGGLRIRLLMKETVRGPLGGSLLLGIHAGIRRKRAHGASKRGSEHAAAGVSGQAAEEGDGASRVDRDRGRGGDTELARRIGRMPGPRAVRAARTTDERGGRRGRTISPAERSAEHGQARLRLRFRQVVLKGEEHGMRTARARSPRRWFVDASYRSGIQLLAERIGPSKFLIA
jgi:hypothetical protein